MTNQKKVDLGTWLASKNKEDSTNKVTSISSSSTDTQYPSAKAVYDELENKADTSDVPTKTSDLDNDGADGSHAFITAQDITGKENISNKVTSLSAESTDTQYPSAKAVYDELEDKADSADLATVATSGSYNDLSNKPTIPTVVDTIEDSNNNAVTSNAVYDGLALKADASHTHAASEVLDSTAHSNLNTAANATQAAINTAIDSAVGSILAMEMIVVDTADAQGKPSTPASASTMNKLYLTKPASGKEDNYAEFITVRTGTSSYTYSWEKIGDVSLDLSGYVRKEDVDLEIANDELILTLD